MAGLFAAAPVPESYCGSTIGDSPVAVSGNTPAAAHRRPRWVRLEGYREALEGGSAQADGQGLEAGAFLGTGDLIHLS